MAGEGETVNNAQDFGPEPGARLQEHVARCRMGPGQRVVVPYACAGAVAHPDRGRMERRVNKAPMPRRGIDGQADRGNILRSPGPGMAGGDDDNLAGYPDLPLRSDSLWLDDDLMVERRRSVSGDLLPGSAPSL